MKRGRRIIRYCFLMLVLTVSTVMPFSPSFDLQAPLTTQIETASAEDDLSFMTTQPSRHNSQIAASEERIYRSFDISFPPQPAGLPTHLVETLARNRYANKDDAGDNGMTIPPMQGRVAVITGAAGGIGRELTKVVYSLGCTVVALDRNITGLELLREDLEGRRSNGKDIEDDRSRVLCLVTNHEDLSSVSSSADVIKTKFRTIDLLVCNAGLTYRDGCVPGEERMKSKHGYDLAFTVNYLSHFLLVEKLLPCLSCACPSGRIVHLTSSFHWKVDGSEITPLDNGMNGPMAYQRDPSLMSSKHIERSYANSKLAQIWHSRTTKKCVGSVCACPTWAGTGIAGEESRDFLLQNAIDVSGPGIASALNAMLRSDDELEDALNDGTSIVANSRVIEFIPFKDLWAMDWISRSGLRDIMAEVSALVLLIGQRFTFEQFIIQRSSPESYGCKDEMESLRRWSLKEVEPFL